MKLARQGDDHEYAGITHSGSHYTKPLRLEGVIDVDPAMPRSNIHRLLVRRNLDLFEVFHGKSDAAFNARSSGKCGVTSALRSKGALGKAR